MSIKQKFFVNKDGYYFTNAKDTPINEGELSQVLVFNTYDEMVLEVCGQWDIDPDEVGEPFVVYEDSWCDERGFKTKYADDAVDKIESPEHFISIFVC